MKNLIQLRLLPILIEESLSQVREEYKTFVLKPLYIDELLNKSKMEVENDGLFQSDFSKSLNSVSCMIATQQEGYLFHFEDIGGTSLEHSNRMISVDYLFQTTTLWQIIVLRHIHLLLLFFN